MTGMISKKERISYGLGGLGTAAYQVMVMSFIIYFYTDVFGITATAVATLMLVSRIWDGINDPIMGVVLDRTRSRWGRFRPYMLFVPPFLAVSFILLFSTPDLSQSGKLIYAYITYIVYVMLYTMYDISCNSLAPAMSYDRNEKKSLIALLRLLTGFAALVAVFGMPAVQLFGKGMETKGFQMYAIIIAIVCITVSWIAFFNTRERVTVEKHKKTSAHEYFKIIINSKPLIVLFLFMIITGTATNIQSGLTIHYVKHYLERADLIPILTLISFVTYLIAAALAAPLSKKISSKWLLIVGMSLTVAIITLRFFFAKACIPLLYVLTTLNGLIGGFVLVFVFMMINDIIDFIEWKHKNRTEGFVFSLIVFAQKLSMALGGSLAAVMLAFINYKSGSDIQTPAAIEGINYSMTVLPIIITVVGIVVIAFYSLSEKQIKQITEDLKIRSLTIESVQSSQTAAN